MKRIETFAQTLNSLEEYLATPVTEKRDLAGIVAGFTICAEVAWKSAQDAIAELGYPDRGPKPALTAAFRAGLIGAADAEVWGDLLTDRNLMVHTYRPELAEALVARIRTDYAPAMRRLLAVLAGRMGRPSAT